MFLTISDSTDVGVAMQSSAGPDPSDFRASVQNFGASNSTAPVQSSLDTSDSKVPVQSSLIESSVGRTGQTVVTDKEIAEQLQLEAREAQLAQDEHLAEQLQLKENSYRIPR